jgi:hypothetical protein
VAVTLFLLKRARYAANLLGEMETISHIFAALDVSHAPDEQRAALFSYTWAVGHVAIADTRTFVRRHAWRNLEDAVMSAAEKLKAEGREEGREAGREEGRREGQAQALLTVMRSKFRVLSPAIESKIAAASTAQLAKWLERVSAAQGADDVIRD